MSSAGRKKLGKDLPKDWPIELNILLKAVARKKQEFFDEKASPRVLVKKLDLAYEIYQLCNQIIAGLASTEKSYAEIKDLRDSILSFLKTVLRTNEETAIPSLMKKRAQEQLLSLSTKTQVIPGVSPPHFTSLPKAEQASSRAQYNWRRLADLGLAATPDVGKLAMQTEASRQEDKEKDVKAFTPEQRAAHRIIIKDGLFYQINAQNPLLAAPCDTSNMLSHAKKGFASFTINVWGEISIFNHLDVEDKIAHSTMNAGGALIGVGELQIENGQLKVLTDHSGHYQPAVLHTYHLLYFLRESDLQLSDNTLVRLFFPLEPEYKLTLVERVSTHEKEDISRYVYYAKDILNLDPALIRKIEKSEEDEDERQQISFGGLQSSSSSESDDSDKHPPAGQTHSSDSDEEFMVKNPMLGEQDSGSSSRSSTPPPPPPEDVDSEDEEAGIRMFSNPFWGKKADKGLVKEGLFGGKKKVEPEVDGEPKDKNEPGERGPSSNG